MRPKNQKELVKYLKRKGGLFSEHAKLVTDKKLNQITLQLNQTLEGRHARHLFLFNPKGQTLVLLDHLILTTKGLVLIEKVPVQKQVAPLDEHWWQHTRNGRLIPNECYQLHRISESLGEILSEVLDKDIPMFCYPVAEQAFIQGVYPLTEILNLIPQRLMMQETVLSVEEIQRIEQRLTHLQEKSEHEKMNHYYPKFTHTLYNPLKPISIGKNKTKPHPLMDIYQLLNDLMFDELSSGRLYHRIKLAEFPQHQNTIQTVLLSEKGILLFNYLEPELKIQIDLPATKWNVLRLEDSQWQQLKIDNPILLLEAQADQLLKQLNAPVPLTYRIIGMNPIDLELAHPSLTLEVNLEHTLDRYVKSTPSTLTEVQLDWLKDKLKLYK